MTPCALAWRRPRRQDRTMRLGRARHRRARDSVGLLVGTARDCFLPIDQRSARTPRRGFQNAPTWLGNHSFLTPLFTQATWTIFAQLGQLKHIQCCICEVSIHRRLQISNRAAQSVKTSRARASVRPETGVSDQSPAATPKRPRPGNLSAGRRRSKPRTAPKKLSSTPSTQPIVRPT